MSNSKERKVLLTPECQSLWVVSPALLFFYDKVLMDQRDFDWMLNPKLDTKLTVRRAEILNNLNEWGLIETVAYETYLPSKKRLWIHQESERLVEKLLPKEDEYFYDSQFVSRALHAHKEFSKYVENVILFCDLNDDILLEKNIERLSEVNKRIITLQEKKANDDMLEEIKWTLERIIAKSFAGLYVANQINPNGMYDTDEYRPFIGDIIGACPELSNSFHGDLKKKTLRIVLGALQEKKVPDISLWEQSKFFSFLRSQTEFIKLRDTLNKIEELYGGLLRESEELVRKKIQIDINQLELEFDEELKTARDNFLSKCTWRGGK